jgi:hypothetical protein
MKRNKVCSLLLTLAMCASSVAQSPTSNSETQKPSVVPEYVKFNGTAKDVNGKPLTGVIGITFSLYRSEAGGGVLWMETQNVQVDSSGRYNVSLGSAKPLPVELFASGEARWLGVQVANQVEQPRVLLMSVPYALKAADAETLGGRPASAFMAAAAPGSSGDAALPPAGTITGGGTANFVPLFTGPSTIGNSKIFQTAGGNFGIATTTPAAKLDVKGTGDFRDTLTLFPKTTHPALSISGTAFQVSNAGTVTFVSGQTFPGTGTITGVTAGADLAGGGTTGKVTLSLDTTKVPLLASSNTFNAGQTVKGNLTLGGSGNGVIFPDGSKQTTAGGGTITGVTAGTGLTGGGTSGNVTLNLDATKIPQLNANNAFTKNNTFAGTVGIGTTSPGAQLDVEAPATSGTGIQGVTSSTAFFAAGVFGHATGKSGETRGVYGASDSPAGIGVHGIGAIGGQFETGNGNIFVGRGQGANRVTIDSLGNTSITGAITSGGVITSGGGVFATLTGGGTGVYGSSDSGTGVFGSGGVGVLGESSNGNGLQGFSSSSSGVYGAAGSGSSFAGIAGVWGDAANNVGVLGSSNSFPGVLGESHNGYGVWGVSSAFDGVNGVTHGSNVSGVAGINDAPGGTGVYGLSTNGGFGFKTPSNVSQDRSAGGWVKAMVFVDPYTQNGTAITRCYNSQGSGAAISTPPCGFGITHRTQGVDVVDLGFQVNDRFISVSSAGVTTTCVSDPHTCNLSISQILVATLNLDGSGIDTAFWIIVF